MDLALTRSPRPGYTIYGLAMIGFGLIALVRLDAIPGLEPVGGAPPLHTLVGIVSGLATLGAGAMLVANRAITRSAVLAAALFTLVLALLHAPKLVMHPTNGGAWVSAFEIVAICAAAWMLAAARSAERRWRAIDTGARYAFSISLVAFGASHFVYHQYIESVIPGWIPVHAFFGYAVGVAFIAAGLSIMSGIQARLAATLLGVQYGTWVLIIHWPRVIARPLVNEWTSLCVAIAMCGASWIVAASLARSHESPVRAGAAARDRSTAREPSLSS